MKTYNINHVSTCLPDYFSGSHHPVVQVILTNTSTYKEVKAELLDWQTSDHIDDLDFDAYKQAIEVMFANVTLDEVIDPSLDELEDDCCDYVHMFFVVEENEEEEVNDVYKHQLAYARDRVRIVVTNLSVAIIDITDCHNATYLSDYKKDKFEAEATRLYFELDDVTKEEANLITAYPYIDLLM